MNKSERFWDLLSYKYDKMAKRVEEARIRMLESINRYINNEDVVLDYACGTGLIANEIARNVKKIYAIDTSSKMINTAKRKAAERNIENIDFSQSTIFDKQFKRESFDVILVFNVLHMLEDSRRVVKRINELLNPGGIMISSTACMEENEKSSINGVLTVLSEIGIVPYLRFFKISELEDLITNTNFQIIETEDFYDFAQSNHFIVAKKDYKPDSNFSAVKRQFISGGKS